MTAMRESWIFGLGIALAAIASHGFHRALDETALPTPKSLEETLPSPAATRLLSLGHYALAADYYWLRSLEHFGDLEMHRALYPNLEPFLSRAVNLDPQFKSLYYLAGTALTLRGMDPHLSNRILRIGLEHRPDVWQIPFYLGFNLLYFDHDFANAATMLARAAALDGAPPLIGQLAARLSAEAGAPEVGLRLVNTILENLGDKDKAMREDYERRRNLLRLEVELKWLQKAADRFAEDQGREANSLDELVDAGLLTAVPRDPLGGEYSLVGGTVQTTSENERLRLSKIAKDHLDKK